MPVLDRPTIQYVVEEAVQAGIDDILIITGRCKQAIERHFDKSYELEQELKAVDGLNRLERVQDIADIHYIRQKERNGLGDVVLYAQDHVGNESFALWLGDTIIETEPPCIETLITQAKGHNSSVLSLERVPWAEVPKYGVADVRDDEVDGSSFSGADFVEKPMQDAAPSNLAITGRYVFTHEIFGYLEETETGVGGELQLIDAIRKLNDVRGIELNGSRYDIGNIPSWVQGNIEMAINHDDGEMNTAVNSLIQEYAQ
jgi:UTP--glucose-1-phosphate uridylyltransferase